MSPSRPALNAAGRPSFGLKGSLGRRSGSAVILSSLGTVTVDSVVARSSLSDGHSVVTRSSLRRRSSLSRHSLVTRSESSLGTVLLDS
jgi:hypothetical protein